MAVNGILGKKVGMTQLFDDKGDVHPITVLQAGPCVITQKKSQAKEGYDACVNGEVVRVPGLANQMSALWSQTQPRWLVRTLTGFFGRQRLRP